MKFRAKSQIAIEFALTLPLHAISTRRGFSVLCLTLLLSPWTSPLPLRSLWCQVKKQQIGRFWISNLRRSVTGGFHWNKYSQFQVVISQLLVFFFLLLCYSLIVRRGMISFRSVLRLLFCFVLYDNAPFCLTSLLLILPGIAWHSLYNSEKKDLVTGLVCAIWNQFPILMKSLLWFL